MKRHCHSRSITRKDINNVKRKNNYEISFLHTKRNLLTLRFCTSGWYWWCIHANK